MSHAWTIGKNHCQNKKKPAGLLAKSDGLLMKNGDSPTERESTGSFGLRAD